MNRAGKAGGLLVFYFILPFHLSTFPFFPFSFFSFFFSLSFLSFFLIFDSKEQNLSFNIVKSLPLKKMHALF